ncbi:hypothetical protein ACIRYZ_38905 [Kitasatospora sp. NPDC101155]|uniref:hypothetical protein n=1 Tax=Kitasatospora sp. NPDC101155 TaxID=3364097 RepID=UPI003800A0B1
MTKHSVRTYRAAAAYLLDSLADGVSIAAALAAGLLTVTHYVPIDGQHAAADLTFSALSVLVMALAGCGYVLRDVLRTLADLAAPTHDPDPYEEIPTAFFAEETEPGVYTTEHEGTWPEAVDWAIEAAVAVGQLRVDVSQPEADLDDLLISLQASHLVRELHDLLAKTAEQYTARGEQHDQEEADTLREAAAYVDMAALTLGDKPEQPVLVRPQVPPPAYLGAGAEDDELTF